MADTVATRVHLVRHCEVLNPGRILYGRLPGYHLSDRGREMAKAVAGFLAGRDVTLLWSSPLDRAMETAVPLAAQFGLEVCADERLTEAWNRFEGLAFGAGDGVLRRPLSWRHLWNPLRPSWGEPYANVAARMLAVTGDAARAARGREAVLVSHQLPIWVTRRAAEGRRLWHDPRRRQCALGSVTTLTYQGGRVTGVGYAEPVRPRTRSLPGA
jgi:broad specificity phosphatase PhoE